MRFKDSSIRFNDLSPQLLLALMVVDDVMKKNGQEALITSLNDAFHSTNSLHYAGNAVDLRSHWFAHPSLVLGLCREALGNSSDFDMILENEGETNEHFHLEYQPKRRNS